MRYRLVLVLPAILGLNLSAFGQSPSVSESPDAGVSDAKPEAQRAGEDGKKAGENAKAAQGAGDLTTKFINVKSVDVESAAALVSKVFTDKAGKGGTPLQVVPSPRTGQLFLTGSSKDTKAAEALIEGLDRLVATAKGGDEK